MTAQILYLPTLLLERLADALDDAFEATLRRHGLTVFGGAVQIWNGAQYLLVTAGPAVTGPRRPAGPRPGILWSDAPHPECRHWLAPLAPAERRQQISAVRDGLSAAAQLSGHDRLALAEHLDRALTAPSAGAATPGPAPQPLRRDRAALRALGSALDEDLAAFDRALTTYRGVARETDPWLADLAWWAELATAWRPTGERVEGVPVIAASAGRRRGGIAAVQQSAMNAAFAAAALRARVLPSVPFRESASDPGFVQAGHRLALRELADHAPWGVWRHHSVLIRDPGQGRTVGLGAAPETIARRMAAWGRRFHRHRWTGHHPLVRSGLAHLELMRIHPFADGNGRVGRIVVDAMHAECGLPPLPLAAVLEARRADYLNAVRTAAATDDPAVYLRWHIHALTAAVAQLAATSARCAALHDRIRQAIGGRGIAPTAADRLTQTFWRLPACVMADRALYARTSADLAEMAGDRLVRAGLGARVRLGAETLFVLPEALALARAGT